MSVWGASWKRFRTDPETLLLPVLVAGVCWVVVQVLAQLALDEGVHDPVTTTILSTWVFCFLGVLFWAVAVRTAAGDGPRIRDVLPPLTLLAAGLALALTLGLGFAVVPALVIAFLAQFAVQGVVVDGLGAPAAVIDSTRRVVTAPGAALRFGLVAIAVLGLGALLGGVGLWPASTLVALAQVAHRGPGRLSA